MNCSKSVVLAAMVAATCLSTLPQAHAGDGWRHRSHDRVHVERHDDAGVLIGAGILGLAVGALIASGNDASADREPIYREQFERPRPYRDWYPVDENPPDVVYDDGTPYAYRPSAEPWTAEWYDWCEQRYRSFDARTGTYRGYEGRDHFCVAD